MNHHKLKIMKFITGQKYCLYCLAGLSLLATLSLNAAELPNILIISVDDMGWGQPNCYGGKLAPTPNMDALAAGGLRFTDAYASSCVCSPSRVGLMTGRYPARTGHDSLTVPNKPESQLLVSETTIAQRLKALGYATGIVGKWHLGADSEHLPIARGFDFSYGSTANVSEGKDGERFYEGDHLIADPVKDFVTTPVYQQKALQFLDANQKKPWFLYLAENNVHGPTVASEAYYQKFAEMTPVQKQHYAADIAEVDDAIGGIMNKLRELNLETNTLVFFLSDNGKSSPYGEEGDLRGQKWTTWEGGIRIPFVIQWKGRIPGGQVTHVPAIQLDVFPTAIAAAGGSVLPEWKLDGVNLLPWLESKTTKLEPRPFYWRFGPQYAVRQGDWKIVKAAVDMKPMLVNLAADQGEQKDLSTQYPEKMKDLQSLWDRWDAGMIPPRWQDKRWDGLESMARQKEQGGAKKNKGDRKSKNDANPDTHLPNGPTTAIDLGYRLVAD